MTDSISQPIVPSRRAETVPVEFEERLLPSLRLGGVVFRQEIDKLTDAAGPVPANHELFVRVFHDGSVADREAFGFERKNVGNHTIGIDTERQSIIARSTRSFLFFGIWVVRLPRQEAFVDQVEMLKFLIVETEEQCWNHPIRMTNRSEMLHREHG